MSKTSNTFWKTYLECSFRLVIVTELNSKILNEMTFSGGEAYAQSTVVDERMQQSDLNYRMTWQKKQCKYMYLKRYTNHDVLMEIYWSYIWTWRAAFLDVRCCQDSSKKDFCILVWSFLINTTSLRFHRFPYGYVYQSFLSLWLLGVP